MKLEIDAPFGSVTLDPDDPNYPLILIKFFMTQLDSFKNPPSTKRLTQDKQGYQYLLTKNDPALARRFLNHKHDLRARGVILDNLAVLRSMGEDPASLSVPS